MYRSKSTHVYAQIDHPTQSKFTNSQFVKLHKQCFHPSAEKLFNLLKIARSEEATIDTFQMLQDITKNFGPFQRIKTAPTRFRVSFGAENVRFNERVVVDIVHFDRRPILHIVGEGTRFSAASFFA